MVRSCLGSDTSAGSVGLYRVIRFSPFANRLAYDGIPKKIQKLRCYTNFVALRFSQPIAEMGDTVVKRMKAKSASTNGNYVSIHLRFEEVYSHLISGLALFP